MFSMYPDGWPGAGLLLLRLASGALLIVQSAAYFGDKRDLGFFGVALAAIAAAVVVAAGFFAWLPKSTVGPLVTPATAALATVIAVAVICLGPGSLSLDARMFGRREIVIPPSSPRE